MKRWVLNQERFFYAPLAGAVIGAAIGLIAYVLADGSSRWVVRVLRLVAALVIFAVGLFLLRISRDMERIDRAVEMKRKEPGSTLADLERFEQALKEDENWSGQVFPNFVRALFFLVIALALLFTSSFPL
jgi:sulfite exporter TauE/SafE